MQVTKKEMTSADCAPTLPERRLVLLGRKGVGKSAAANTILGGNGGFESGRPTEECSKRRIDQAGRRIIVVDTPGWEWYYPLNSTPEWVRRETLRSVSLCPPGPHVVLLVVRSCTSMTESYRRQIEEHLEDLGEGVLEHTMLLFTRGDELGVVPMEHRILTSGAAFQQLLQRCGNRYHVFDNRTRGDETQVTELLRKIEAIVDANEGRHFGANPALLGLEADGRRRARERRKRQRQMEAQTQRGTIRAALLSDIGSQGSEWDGKQPFSKGSRRLPELRLVLLGERETGKSSTGNTILGGGGAGYFQTGMVTEECSRCQAEVAMRLVTVVDTPGWEGGVAGPTPERVKREMVWGSVSLCPPGPHAMLLTLRVDTLVSAAPVREHLELLGDGVWRHTVLLFTHGDQLRTGVSIEQHIQSGGKDLQWLVEKCGNRYHVISNVSGCGGEAQVSGLLEKVEKMVTGNRCEAFSSIVQEVSDLTRQRNDKFNQRLKELGDKMLRQEAELKRMREREMKSIRWFFERKKKVKSPGKSGEEKVEDGGEEEWKRSDGRKIEMGDLEERMRWLTEDKEREIQDLSTENYRVSAALHQASREKEEGIIKLEEKEREIEELKERVDDQQVKLLDLERAIVKRERETKEREEELRERHLDWGREAEEFKGRINTEEKEKEDWKERLAVSQKLMYDLKKLYEEKFAQHEVDMDSKLHSKNIEMEDLRMLSKIRETEWREELSKTDEMQKSEIDKLREIIEEKSKDTAEALRLVTERDEEVNRLKESDKQKRSEIATLQQQHAEYKRRSDAETRNLLHVKDVELQHLKQKDRESERELVSLRQTIKQTKADLVNLTTKMEKEMTNMIREYEKEIKRKDEEADSALDEKICTISRLQKMADEKERRIFDIKERLLEKERTVEELQEMNVKMKKDTDNLMEECVKYERDREAHRTQSESREAEVRQLLCGYEEKLRNKDLEIESVLTERDQEVAMLKQAKYEIQTELERTKEEKEKQKHVDELRRREMQAAQEQRDEEKEKELEKRERELEEKELDQWKRKEDLDNQGFKLEVKEKELTKNEEELGNRGLEVRNREVDLQILQKALEKREHELLSRENGLKTNEDVFGSQVRNLSSKEKDIEKREKELKNWDTELGSKEFHLKSREEKIEKMELALKNLQQVLDNRQQELDKEQYEKLSGKEEHLNQIQDLLIREKNLRSREQEIDNREHDMGCGELELKNREKEYKQIQNDMDQKQMELKKHQQDLENKEVCLKNQEKELQENLEDLKVKEKALKESEEKLENKENKLIIREQELVNWRTELEIKTKLLNNMSQEMEKREKEIENIKQDIERREREIENHQQSREESDVQMKYRQLAVENRESEMENQQQALETREKEMEKRQHDFEKQEMEMNKCQRDLDKERENHQQDFKTLEKDMENRQQALEKKEMEMNKYQRDLERERENHQQDLERKAIEKETCLQALENKEKAIGKRQQALEKAEADIANSQQDMEKREREMENHQKALEKRQMEMANRQQTIEKREYEVENHQQHMQKNIREIENRQHALENMEENMEGRQQALENTQKEMENRQQAVERRENKVENHQQSLEKKEREMENHQHALENREREIENQQQVLINREDELKTWEHHLKRLETELERKEQEQRNTNGFDKEEDELDNSEYNRLTPSNELFTHKVCDTEVYNDRTLGRVEAHTMYQEVGVLEKQRQEMKGEEPARNGNVRDRKDLTMSDSASSDLQKKNGFLERTSALKEKGAVHTLEGQVKKEDEGDKELCKGDSKNKMKRVSGFSRIYVSPGPTVTNTKQIQRSELRLVLLGEAWSRRYPAAYTLLGSEVSYSGGSISSPLNGEIAGRQVSVLEPMGLKWRNGPNNNNTTTTTDSTELQNILQSQPGPHAILLVIPAYLSFTPKYRRAVEHHMGELGEDIWRRTMVLFTWGEALGESAEQHILRNGDLQWLVGQCADRYHVLASGKNVSQTAELMAKIEKMMAVNDGYQYTGN